MRTLGILLILSIAAVAEVSAQDINLIKAHSVRIGVYVKLQGETNFRQLGHGSGYWVSDREIVTNAHVAVDLARARRMAPESVKSRVAEVSIALQIGPDNVVPTEVVWREDSKDLAILRIRQTLNRPAVTFALTSAIQLGSETIVGGFPGVSDVGSAGMHDPSVTFGRLNKITDSDLTYGGYRVTAKVLQTDAPINGGNSGGPMFNGCGQLIGTNAFGPDNSSIGFAIHADEVLRVLPRYNIRPQIATEPCTGALELTKQEIDRLQRENALRAQEYERQTQVLQVQQGRINEMLTSLERSRRDAESARRDAETARAESEEARRQAEAAIEASKIQNNPLLMSVLAFSVLMGGFAMYLSLTKRGNIMVREAVISGKELVTRKSYGGSAYRGSGPAKPVLVALSGPLAGSRLDMGGEPLAIGRDPRVSHVIFPADTEDVSKRHCLIQFEPGSKTFTLEDSNSTNGTYLRNGKKLTPGEKYVLNPDDRFYLSGSSISFRVTLENA